MVRNGRKEFYQLTAFHGRRVDLDHVGQHGNQEQRTTKGNRVRKRERLGKGSTSRPSPRVRGANPEGLGTGVSTT